MAIVTKTPTPANFWQSPVDLYLDVAAPTSHVPPTQADEVALDASGQPASLQMAVTAASNTSPIVLTGASTTGFNVGDLVTVAGVGGNTNANGLWTVSALTATTLTLAGSAGNALFTSGGTVTQGAHLGILQGPTTGGIEVKLADIDLDQFEGPYDAALLEVLVTVESVMREVDLYKLLALTSNLNIGNFAALASGAPYTTLAVQLGGASSAALNLRRLMFVGPSRVTAGKWLYLFLFKGYNDDPITISFERAKPAVWKVKFHGVADLTRLAGDEVAHVVKTK